MNIIILINIIVTHCITTYVFTDGPVPMLPPFRSNPCPMDMDMGGPKRQPPPHDQNNPGIQHGPGDPLHSPSLQVDGATPESTMTSEPFPPM